MFQYFLSNTTAIFTNTLLTKIIDDDVDGLAEHFVEKSGALNMFKALGSPGRLGLGGRARDVILDMGMTIRRQIVFESGNLQRVRADLIGGNPIDSKLFSL